MSAETSNDYEMFNDYFLERDLSRANWQRGIGAIVIRELTEGIFDELPEITQQELERIEFNAQESSYKDIVWKRAHYLSDALLRANTDEVYRKAAAAPQPLNRQIDMYAYEHSLGNVMREGFSTMAAFPISLARSISEAEEDSIGGTEQPRFKVNSLNDIATILRQPYFRDMVETALITSNGFWKHFSTSKRSMLPEELFSIEPYDFHPDGSVSFSTKAVSAMRDAMREANTKAYPPPASVNVQSSSGCPARHLRPQLVGQDETGDLEMLSKYFAKSTAELTETHAENVVQRGLDYVANGLERYSSRFAKLDEEYATDHEHPSDLDIYGW